MRILLMGQAEKAALANLVKHAEANIFRIDDLLDTVNKEMRPAGDMEGFSCIIPDEYRVVYTLEAQPVGMVRHLSVSVPGKDNAPHPSTVQAIMEEIGFSGTLLESRVYKEPTGPDTFAINVLEIIGTPNNRI